MSIDSTVFLEHDAISADHTQARLFGALVFKLNSGNQSLVTCQRDERTMGLRIKFPGLGPELLLCQVVLRSPEAF